MKHELDELILIDASIAVTFGSQCVEPVRDDARQVHVLNEGDLVDGLLRV